jgi:hypothetical protein
LGAWLRETMAERFATISEPDLNLFRMMDDVEEVADYLKAAEAGQTWQTTRGFMQPAPEQQLTAEGTRYGIRPRVTPAPPNQNHASKAAKHFPQA